MDQTKMETISFLPIILVLILSIAITSPMSLAAENKKINIYDNNGWEIYANSFDTHVNSAMNVVIDGNKSIGKAAFIEIYHKSENHSRFPEVTVIYASGYLKLKQNADPKLSIPLGGSLVLGPAIQRL